MKMRIEGLKQVDEALKELPRATSKNVVRRVLRNRAEMIAFQSSHLVQFRTGEIANSMEITSRVNRRQKAERVNSRTTVAMYVGFSSSFAHLLEYGTRKMAPQPFMRPAFEQMKYKVLEGIQKDLMNEIEKAKARQARKAARIARRQALGLE